MEINFECTNCKRIFDCDVGLVTLPEDSLRPHFENEIVCPSCGKRSMDEVLLTELGQSQLSSVTLAMEDSNVYNGGLVDDFRGFEGECQGCDTIQELNDLGLCDTCAGKLDRDLIRQRDWEYSSLAYGCPKEKLEDLRADIIKHHGKKYELISPPKEKVKKKKKSRLKKKNRGKRR